MAKYTVELKYISSIVEIVDANDEGEALDKARDLAEEADLNDFTIIEEETSRIIHQE